MSHVPVIICTHAEIEKIWYVCARNACRPSAPCAEIIEISSAEDLQTALTRLLSSRKIDAVIHTMAVSDYTLRSLTTAEQLASSIADGLVRDGGFCTADETQLAAMIAASITEQDSGLARQGKVSSELEHLILTMKKTPKIIGLIAIPNTEGFSRCRAFPNRFQILIYPFKYFRSRLKPRVIRIDAV